MASAAGSSLSMKQTALGDLGDELKTTRRLLERAPEDRFSWRPHGKSMSLGELSAHVADLLQLVTAIARNDGFDLASGDAQGPKPPASREELLRAFDANASQLESAIEALDDAALAQPWTLRRGEQELFTAPRSMALRRVGVSHLIHHRGQLSVYLRLLDVPLPSIYGPSADEQIP